MSKPRTLPISYPTRVWIGVYGAGCALVTLFKLLMDAVWGDAAAAAQLPYWMGFAVCMPLLFAGIPSVLRRLYFVEQQRAASLRQTGNLAASLNAYQRQLQLVIHHRWLEALRGYIFLDRPPEVSLCEELLLALAQVSYDLRQYAQANHYLWRCLGHNPQNTQAHSLLERIRIVPHDGIVGW